MPSLFDEHVEGGAPAFFGGHPSRREDRLRAVRLAARPVTAGVLAALRAQQGRLPPSAAREAHLDALAAGAVAVVTGQQAGLFLGPLYTIFKVATAIRFAKRLAEESGHPVVPIFWLQVEDHDLPEIAECHVAGSPGQPPVRLALAASAESRVSIAHLLLPPELEPLVERLEAALVPLPHAGEHVALVRRHWKPGASWADAFAGMLAEIFEPDGLLVLQPRDPAFAACAAPLHRRALEQADEIERLLLERDAALRAHGHEPAVRVRQGSPLSFFHAEGAAGSRRRLERCEGGFREIGETRTWTLAQLLERLEADPLAFSTSALLRPVVQDALLPVAAYVGGPGEIAYLAQAEPLHEAFGIPMPLSLPRARFRVVDESTARVLERIGARPADAALPEDELLARCRDASAGDALDLDARLLAPFRDALRQAAPELQRAGQGLDKAIERAEAAVAEAVAKLKAKHERALLHADEKLVEDVRRVRAVLHPLGQPQERVLGLASFAAREGTRAFVERVLAAIEPLDFSIKDLR